MISYLLFCQVMLLFLTPEKKRTVLVSFENSTGKIGYRLNGGLKTLEKYQSTHGDLLPKIGKISKQKFLKSTTYRSYLHEKTTSWQRMDQIEEESINNSILPISSNPNLELQLDTVEETGPFKECYEPFGIKFRQVSSRCCLSSAGSFLQERFHLLRDELRSRYVPGCKKLAGCFLR